MADGSSQGPASALPPEQAAPAAGPGQGARPAYYAARQGAWRDWWTLLHPPYTAWHLSYVVIGAALAPPVGLGIAGISRAGWALLPFLVIGPVLVIAYNAELFGGIIHTDLGFAVAWGAFPVLTAYAAQTGRLAVAPVLAAAAALALSAAQRRLSTPARIIRRRTARVDGSLTLATGETVRIDAAALLAPLEHALRAMSWAIVLLAASLAVARLA